MLINPRKIIILSSKQIGAARIVFIRYDVDVSTDLLVLTPESEGFAIIEETEDVNRIEVHNKSDKPVLILRGIIAKGGLQNRAFPSTIIVPPRAKIEVTVHCVEQGRWSPIMALRGESSLAMNIAGFEPVFLRLRDALAEFRVAKRCESRAAALVSLGDQQVAKWHGIMMRSFRYRSGSATMDLVEITEDAIGRLDALDDIMVPRDANGYILFVDDKIVAIEIINIAGASRILEELIHSGVADLIFMLDLIEVDRGPINIEDVLDQLRNAEIRDIGGYGVEKCQQIKTKDLHGQIVTHKGKIVHLELINERLKLI
mgnify:CR=1 FL=1